MKNKALQWPLLLVALCTLILSGCKKEDNTDDSLSAEDSSTVTTGLDGIADDAANTAGGMAAFSGKTESVMSFCGVSIDSSQKANGILVINYDPNAGCQGFSKSGSVTVTLLNYAGGTRWKDAGATLQLLFNNVSVTNTVTGGSFTLSGTHYLTNITGGLAWKIMNGQEPGIITYRHSADNFNLAFADGTVRTWSVRRSRTFSSDGTMHTVTLTGDTAINGISGVQAWGTSRNGFAFTGAIASPIISNSSCGIYKPVSGHFAHQVANRNVDVLLGVDANGNGITAGCAYGFKITYTRNSHTRTRVVQYWM